MEGSLLKHTPALNQLFFFIFYFRLSVVGLLKLLELFFPILVFSFFASKKHFFPREFIPLGVFVLFVFFHSAFFSIVNSSYHETVESVRYAYALFCVYVVYCYFIDSRSDIEKALFNLLYIGVAICSFSLIAYFLRGYGFLGFLLNNSAQFRVEGVRITGLDINPNYFSVYLLLLSSVSIVFLMVKRNAVSLIFLAVVALTIAFTFSRTAMASFVVQIFVLFLLLPLMKGWLKPLLIIPFFFILLSFVLWHYSNFFEMVVFRLSQEGGRSFIWNVVWDVIKNNPALGIGLKNSGEYFVDMYGIAYTPHNEYLNVWSSLGLLGLVIFLFYNFVFLVSSLRFYAIHRNPLFLFPMFFFVAMFVFYYGNTVATVRAYWLGVLISLLIFKLGARREFANLKLTG